MMNERLKAQISDKDTSIATLQRNVAVLEVKVRNDIIWFLFLVYNNVMQY